MDITRIEDDHDERWYYWVDTTVSKLLSPLADKFKVLLMSVVVNLEPVELLNASNIPLNASKFTIIVNLTIRGVVNECG